LESLAVVLFLAGCASSRAELVGISTPTPTLHLARSTATTADQGQIRPETTARPPVKTPTATPTLSPTPVAFELCSPLRDLTLPELPEIVSAPYNPPPMGKDDRHQGVDFSFYQRNARESILGLEVQSVLPGQVAAAIPDSFPFGNLVIIETPGDVLSAELRTHFEIKEGESLYLAYAHMVDPPAFQLGDKVVACQVLGQVGKSGNAGIAHLHLEVRRGPAGARFTEFGYYRPDDTPEERQNYLLWRTSGIFQHYDPMELFR
jgi:murein DD-endopeptidase MepM/ murein hydrolase activator NlpD